MAPNARPLTNPLIVGDIADEHVAAVIERIGPARGAIILDVAKLESSSYQALEMSAVVAGEFLDFRVARRGWIRRLAPPHWRRSVEGGSEEAAVRSAWGSLLVAFAGETSVDWLTTIERLSFGENKLLQLRIASRLGIRTPRSAVVSERTLIPAELGETLVVKPLGVGHFTAADSTERVVYAKPIPRDAPELEHLGPAPFLVQERLDADSHLRVVTVNSRAWACELDATGLPLDWRADEGAHKSFAPLSQDAVTEAAIALAREARIGYSSQDWILQGGVPYFIDLNPAGQWLFLPEPVASEVSAEIAQWLTMPIA